MFGKAWSLAGATLAILLAGCSFNPKLDVPYGKDGAPSVVDILDKMYCELMSAVDQMPPAHVDDFKKEEMLVMLQLQVVGQDTVGPSSNFPPFDKLSLAVTGTASHQQTNIMTQSFDLRVRELYDHRNDPGKFDCSKQNQSLQGDLNIARVALSSYDALDQAGFALPTTTKTVSDGVFSGETDFQIVRGVTAGKLTFLIASIFGPTGFSAQNTYTDKLTFGFSKVATPQPAQPSPVYLVPCPTGKNCAEKHAIAVPAIRSPNPDNLENLTQQKLLSLPNGSGSPF